MQKDIIICPYEQNWPIVFAREAERIRRLCLPFRVHIEHVGSTAVLGMNSKPIIDMAIGIPQWDKVKMIAQILESAGYHQGDTVPPPEQRLFFFKCSDLCGDQFHLHVAPIGSKSWNNLLIFRDALRDDSTLSSEYQSLKESLAEKHRQDIDAYTAGKTSFISKVLERVK